MTEHRHDFWGSTGRKEADVTRYDFSHPFLLPKAREFPSQGEPAISRGFGATSIRETTDADSIISRSPLSNEFFNSLCQSRPLHEMCRRAASSPIP
jgi:hypothetical protein